MKSHAELVSASTLQRAFRACGSVDPETSSGCVHRYLLVEDSTSESAMNPRSGAEQGQTNKTNYFICNTQISVNNLRAVAKSTWILSFSSLRSRSEPSLWMPRRPMSMASTR